MEQADFALPVPIPLCAVSNTGLICQMFCTFILRAGIYVHIYIYLGFITHPKFQIMSWGSKIFLNKCYI